MPQEFDVITEAPKESVVSVLGLASISDFVSESFTKAFSSLRLFVLLAAPAALTGLLMINLDSNEMSLALAAPSLIVTLLLAIFSMFMTVVAAKYYLANGAASLSHAMKEVWNNFGSCFWALFLSGLVIFTGYLLLVIPGIILSGLLAFVLQVRLDSEERGIRALARSAELVSGRWFAVVVRLLALVAVAILIQLGLQFVLGFILGLVSISSATVALVNQVVFVPILSALISMIIFYGVSTLYQQLKVSVVADEAKFNSRVRIYTILAMLTPVLWVIFAGVIYFWFFNMIGALPAF
jgi:hypothetical protein